MVGFLTLVISLAAPASWAATQMELCTLHRLQIERNLETPQAQKLSRAAMLLGPMSAENAAVVRSGIAFSVHADSATWIYEIPRSALVTYVADARSYLADRPDQQMRSARPREIVERMAPELEARIAPVEALLHDHAADHLYVNRTQMIDVVRLHVAQGALLDWIESNEDWLVDREPSTDATRFLPLYSTNATGLAEGAFQRLLAEPGSDMRALPVFRTTHDGPLGSHIIALFSQMGTGFIEFASTADWIPLQDSDTRWAHPIHDGDHLQHMLRRGDREEPAAAPISRRRRQNVMIKLLDAIERLPVQDQAPTLEYLLFFSDLTWREFGGPLSYRSGYLLTADLRNWVTHAVTVSLQDDENLTNALEDMPYRGMGNHLFGFLRGRHGRNPPAAEFSARGRFLMRRLNRLISGE